MNKIKVSVIVPVYNTEKYLDKCLNSLVNQTLKDIEIIVVNDGTKDNSEKIIKQYLKKYTNIIYCKKENGGLSSARNYGLEKAKGEYIGFVDSDDYVEYDMYEKMYDKAIKTKSDITCCQIGYRYLKYVEKKHFTNLKCFGSSISKSPEILIQAKSYVWNKIYKKELWNNFKFPNQYFEDSAVIYNVLYTANKIECVDLPLYNYLKEREGAITTEVSDKMYDIFKSCDSILSFYSKQKDYKNLKSVIEELCIKHLRIRLLYLYKCKNIKTTWPFYNCVIKYLKKNIKNYKKNECLKFKKTDDKLYNQKIMVIKLPGYFKFVSLLPVNLLISLKSLIKKPVSLIKKIIKGHSKQGLDEKRMYLQKNGYSVLEETLNLLNMIPGVKGFADFGTMLGLVREHELLKHDLDMDIGVFGEKGIHNLVSMVLERNGYQLWREYIYEENVVEHSFKYKNIKIDINYYQKNNKGVNTWLFYRDPEKKYKNNLRDVVVMNYSNINTLKKIGVKDKEIFIPENAEVILEEKYGPSWRIPDKKWIYWKSPAAKKVDGYGYYIEFKYPNY